MTEKSQNGWLVDGNWSNRNVPGTITNLRVRNDDAGVCLLYLATRFDREAEDIEAGVMDDWAQAYRAIRGQTTGLSNHASGTAIDLNATQHPLGKVGTFSGPEVAAIQRILADCEGVIRAGMSYSGRKDEMHFEINVPMGDPRLARVAEKAWAYWRSLGLFGGVQTTTPPPAIVLPAPTAPAQAQGNDGYPLKKGSKGTNVRILQERLRGAYPLYAKGLANDGDFGQITENIVKEFQRRSGLSADGIVGPVTRKRLGL